MDILQATSSGSDSQLENLVRQEDYREIFVKLTRNLAPTGKNYERVRIYSYDNPKEILLNPDARQYTNRYIAAASPQPQEAIRDTLTGVLRALDLNRDWLDIDVEGRIQRIGGLEEAVDDLIGPLVNRSVTVTFDRTGRKLRFIDIEEA
jgi:hypothetical protein